MHFSRSGNQSPYSNFKSFFPHTSPRQCSNIVYNLFLWNKFIMYKSSSFKKPMSMLTAFEQTYLSRGHGRWWTPPQRWLLLGFWVTPIQLSHHLWSPYNRILGFKPLLKVLACADTTHLYTLLSRKGTGLLAIWCTYSVSLKMLWTDTSDTSNIFTTYAFQDKFLHFSSVLLCDGHPKCLASRQRLDCTLT